MISSDWEGDGNNSRQGMWFFQNQTLTVQLFCSSVHYFFTNSQPHVQEASNKCQCNSPRKRKLQTPENTKINQLIDKVKIS